MRRVTGGVAWKGGRFIHSFLLPFSLFFYDDVGFSLFLFHLNLNLHRGGGFETKKKKKKPK